MRKRSWTSTRLGGRAIVIGASLAGLFAATLRMSHQAHYHPANRD
jgi:hypothetical protein